MTEHCALCGRPLPSDTRWRIMRWLNPRPPFCLSDLEACYRGYAGRIGITVTDDQVREVVARRRRR